MNHLNANLQMIKLKAQHQELINRTRSDHLLMKERDGIDTSLEENFKIMTSIKSLRKEIRNLITQQASYKILFSLHHKLSAETINISDLILKQSNLVR